MTPFGRSQPRAGHAGTAAGRRWRVTVAGLGLAIAGVPLSGVAAQLVVDPRGPVPTITAALAAAQPGAHVTVRAGTYREPLLVITTPGLTLEGEGWPVLDGQEAHTVLVIAADDVTVRGLVLAHSGVANLDDRAGLKVRDARRCLVEGNRLRDNLFGTYLQRSADCRVRDNDIEAHGTRQTTSGNGIHLWYSPGALVEGNRVRGHRDGIYFEFSPGGVTRGNVSERSQRYGLHFMFSDSCRYEGNTFRDNTSGVAVMYSRGITITGNRFERSWGAAAYGLLLKDILGGTIARNTFERNSTGLLLEGSNRLAVADNDFRQNGWAAKVMANAEDDRFTGNLFVANAFDVATNSRSSNSTFDGNYWDAYRGFDLDHDGTGDVPFAPVRLFALVVEQHPATLVLLRSPLVGMLDAAERVLPVLTPRVLIDRHPRMRPPR
ncbi:MAG: nitrous oxide reductase family maturation protein NosD [Gemmatimonadetes bacterium]|nr:nitrous oxide reductase family maturation protein NosD [Gemmatimonadota bacterium]